MWKPLIPRDDPVMARRLRRQLMGVASYLMFLLPMAWAVLHGWMAFDWRGLVAEATSLRIGFGLVGLATTMIVGLAGVVPRAERGRAPLVVPVPG